MTPARPLRHPAPDPAAVVPPLREGDRLGQAELFGRPKAKDHKAFAKRLAAMMAGGPDPARAKRPRRRRP